MANRLQLKRGTTTPGTIFYEGEPIYDKTGKVLYVGDSGGTGTGAGSAVASAANHDAVTEILFAASSSGPGNIRLYEDTDNGTNYVSVAAATLIASNYTLTLPNGTGSDGQVLKTDGSGVLDWVDQTDNSTDVTLVTTTADYLSISGQAITLNQIDLTTDVTGDLPVTEGGTGASDAETARTNLGVDAAGTDNSTDVTLVTTSYDYLSISGQAITLGQITNDDLANSSITVSDGSNSTATALGETITFNGTDNEVTVSESSGTITVGLPDDVTIGGSLTVTENLNVLGTAVTFSVETTRVEDRILELGLVDGAAPSATTTWDTGVAFNYFQTSAKKSGVVWLDNTFMAMLSELSETSDSGNADPQITATSYAPIAAGGLYVGGIASGNEVINSSQAAVNLIFDGGTY